MLLGSICWNLMNCLTLSCGSRDWTFRRLASSKCLNWGRVSGPRTSEEATTDGTASETGRIASATASEVRGFPGSPATHIDPPFSGLTGCSFLKFSIKRCCLRHFEQFSPFEHLCGLGISCSIPTMETDSRGVITSSGFLCRLLEFFRRRGSSSEPHSKCTFCLELDRCLDDCRGRRTSVHGDETSSIGVGGFGVLGALPLRT